MDVSTRGVLLMPDGCPQWQVVHTALTGLLPPPIVSATTPAAVLAGMVGETPSLVLAGTGAPEALPALRHLRARAPHATLVVIAPYFEPAWDEAADELDAAGYLLWQDLETGSWPPLLHLLLAGGVWIRSRSVQRAAPHVPRRTAHLSAPPSDSFLTAREQSVARLLVQDWEYQEIAAALRWSYRTVERTAGHLRAKHHCHTAVALGARLVGGRCPCPLVTGVLPA